MNQIKNNASVSQTTNATQSAQPAVKHQTGYANNDQYAASNAAPSTSDPYAHVDWSKVNYDFSGVDWSKINYNVGSQAQDYKKSQAATVSQSTGYSSSDAIDATGTSSAGVVGSNATSSKAQEKVATTGAGSSTGAAAATGGTGSATGPGVWLTNSSSSEQTYSFYDNASNGNGTANPTYTNPSATESLAPGESKFVSLPAAFKGRVQKTDGDASQNTWATASTWAEFQLSASNDGAAHGDISYQAGFDGAATIASTDGTNRVGGTTENLLADAPKEALAKDANGNDAIARNSNAAATAYLQQHVDESKAYTGTAGSGTDDIASKNNQLAITFY